MNDFNNRGLGKGLDALIPVAEPNLNGGISKVSVALVDVNPHQPRTVFDESELQELADSIKKHGVLQPIVVTPKGEHFELIAGERRLRASKLAGLQEIPVIIRDADDHQKLELAIIENVHRKDLNPIDEAISYRKLIEEFNYSQEKVAEAVGKSRASIANKVRLLTLPVDIKKALKDGRITEGHAKALLAIEDPKKQESVFLTILNEGLSVRDVELKSKTSGEKSANYKEEDLAIKQLAEDLKIFLGAKVKIKPSKKGGQIEIDYYSQEELNRIYQKIKGY